MIIESLIKEVISHPVILSMMGPFLFGGETTLILSMLAGQGFVPFWVVLVFCSLGIWLADSMWFFLGKIESLSRLKKIVFIHKGYKKAKEEIESVQNPFFLLILIKFAYGIGIPILAYLGRVKMKAGDFLLKNTFIILIWSSAIVFAGWLVGKTSVIAFNRFENIYTAIIFAVTGIIVVHLVVRQIRRYLIKEEKLIKKHEKNIHNKALR